MMPDEETFDGELDEDFLNESDEADAGDSMEDSDCDDSDMEDSTIMQRDPDDSGEW